VMVVRECSLHCTIEQPEGQQGKAQVVVKQSSVHALYEQALNRQRRSVQARGFPRGEVPASYFEKTYRVNLIEHLKEFLFNHCVANTLYHEIDLQRIVVAGEPQLSSIDLDPGRDAKFMFTWTQLPLAARTHWKELSIKAPDRRNYKDLDKQVELFLEEETKKTLNFAKENAINYHDWILFSVSIIDHESHEELLGYHEQLWLKIGREEIDREAQLLFLGKKAGDIFTSSSSLLQGYFCKNLDTDYLFSVEILAVVPHSHFSIDRLKNHFGISTEQDVKRILIEIFSHRHDISLRRETVEATLKILTKQFPISLPRQIVHQQEMYILREVQRTPDYPVYRLQKDFRSKINLLAEKQLREALIVDHISQAEATHIVEEDEISLMALLQRPRTKEFIHFDLPITQKNGQEQPLPSNIIKQLCRRERTLNKLTQLFSQKGGGHRAARKYARA